MPCTVT